MKYVAFMNPLKPEVRPGVQRESASPGWIASPCMKIDYVKKQGIKYYEQWHCDMLDLGQA